MWKTMSGKRGSIAGSVRRLRWTGVALLLCAMRSGAAPQPALMPMPAHVTLHEGGFVLQKSLQVRWGAFRNPLLERAAGRFFVRLQQRTGIPFARAEESESGNSLAIRCDGDDAQFLTVQADESYDLTVNSGGVELHAAKPTGVLRGLATLLQLVRADEDGYALQAVDIRDEPRFAWRGILIDVSRHFLPAQDLERQLDAMELLKLNVLHLHLTDNESFSIESKRYPELQRKGAAHGAYYTQEQIRGLVESARDRGIRIMPEFDVPAHTRSWFAGYPELQSRPQLQAEEHAAKGGVLDPTNAGVYRFLDGFFAEMSELFPDRYLHTGGDELAAPHWNNDPGIKQYMQAHAMPDAAALQTYFTQRTEQIVRAKGKTMIAWDETLNAQIPADVAIEVWHKTKVTSEAIRMGHPVIVASFYYLDLLRSAGEYYGADPLQATDSDATEAERRLVLGGEAALWTELVTPETLDAALWPRTAAIAERFWSPAETSDVEDMYRRLEAMDDELEILGTRQHENRWRMIARISPADTQAVQTLADALEPVKGYTRWHRVKKLDEPPVQNTLLDALDPENLAARHFVSEARASVSGGGARRGEELRDNLLRWRKNHAAFERAAQRTPALRPYLPLSMELSTVAKIGLEALDAFERGCKLSDEWIRDGKTVLERQHAAASEKGARPSLTVIAIAPGVEALAEAAVAARGQTVRCADAAQ